MHTINKVQIFTIKQKIHTKLVGIKHITLVFEVGTRNFKTKLLTITSISTTKITKCTTQN